MTGGRLVGLEGLRGIAALCVLAFHAAMIETGRSHGPAYLAVDFFFMLSGFIMARTYEQRFADGLGAGAFMAARLRRLWPVMALGGVIGIPVLAGKLDEGLVMIIALNLLLIPTPIDDEVFPLNGPAWSIFLELFANLAHVLVLRHLSTRTLAWWTALLLVPVTWMVMDHGLAVGARPETMLLGVPRVLLPYAIGMLIWRLWGDTPPLRVSKLFAFAAMPVLFGGLAMLGVRSWVFDLLFVVLVCPLLIAGGLRLQGRMPVVVAAGAISFPLYAVHLPILELAKARGAGVAVGVVLSLAVAGLVAALPHGALWRILALPRSLPLGLSRR
jgi:peptidoglycan/LPS O-acetylase OafA/YrhL